MNKPSDANDHDANHDAPTGCNVVLWGAVLPSCLAVAAFLAAGWIINDRSTYASLGRIGLVFVSVIALAVLPLLNLWLLAVRRPSRRRAFSLGMVIPGLLATVAIVAMWNDRYGPRAQIAEPEAEFVESISQP